MDIKEVFDLVQHEPKNYNKYLKMLHNLYIKEEFDNFFPPFNKHLLQAFVQPFPNCFAKAIISFASSFCLEIVTNFEKQMQHVENAEYESHPFFVHLITAVLKCIPVDDSNVRYHACLLLAMLFTNFGPDISISDVICDKIQKAMIERAEDDPKPHIRLQAITVLTRLQNPHDVNCPIIQSFISSLGDPSPLVRKTVIESIAPCRSTFLHIITRLRDVDSSVRASTYTKLSKLSPKNLTIVHRQSILMNGLAEVNGALQKKFKNVLLTKWLDIYEKNVIQFMRALKLDANEEDLKQTEQIYELLLPIIFTLMPLQELILLLELNESTVIPVEELTLEKVTYWSCLISNLLSDDNMDFEENIPTVVSMVTCIENFAKTKSGKSLELWQYLEYQQTLRKLFELILKLDNSDEFGRQKMRELLIYVLTQVKMVPNVINIVIKTFHNILLDIEQLAYEICSIITDIKDPLEALELPMDVRRDQEIQIAQLKVKHHMKTDELKQAIAEKQYEIVDKLSKEADVFETQIKELQEKFAQPILVRKPHNDVEIICRCLDIAISFLEVLPIEKLPNSLRAFKEEFLANKDIDIRYAAIFQRIFKLSCLYSVIDKDTALQSLEAICAPLLNYRVAAVFDKNVLKTCIGAVSDLIRIYGPSIFDDLSTKDNNKENNKTSRRGTDRTLYCEEDYGRENETVNTVNVEIATTGVLVDIMLGILDDNHSDLRACVAEALGKLIVKGLCVNSSLITRLLLKWFNPTLDTEEKYDRKVQRYIGIALTTYVKKIKSAPSILEKVIIPTICYISNAPKTSPLATVNHEDLLYCLIKFTKIREKTTLDVHRELAYSILSRVSKTNDQSVRTLTKMLLLLELPVDEQNFVRELSEQISIAQNNVSDKVALTSLKKFYNKLHGIANENDTVASANTSDGTVGNIRASSLSCSRKRKISSSDTSVIEKATDQLNISENPPPKFTATRMRTRSCITNDPSLHTIEEQTENVENDSCNTETPSINDSSESSNSCESKDKNKKVASRNGKKMKGKKKTSSSSSNTSSE